MELVVYGVVIAMSLMFGGICGQTIQSKFLEEDILCDVEDRIKEGCSSRIDPVRCLVECVAGCGADTSCIGASLDDDGWCFHHRECPRIYDCTTENRNHRYLTKYCEHGTWNPLSQTCECVDGFYGERCKQCYASCRDLYQAGFAPGHNRVFLDPDHKGQRPFQGVCSKIGSRIYLMFFQKTNIELFNKTWSEYVNGFFIDDNNFWIGLEAFHRVTSIASYCTSVYFYTGVFHYYGMSVSNESMGYSFTPDCPSGDMSHRVSFSTWDNDNDGMSGDNCAANSGSGWWYDDCSSPCNVIQLSAYASAGCNN